MPKRTDLQSILILGAGPIVIGQACEFDYSGVQACKALREEGYRVILVNSNPATIMTDPEMADAVYIEPLHWQYLAKIIETEKPDAVLPTMGGQTALNCALDLVREGILEKNNVELIGASKDAIDKAEDRELFRKAMQNIGLEVPRSYIAHDLEQALKAQQAVGYPTVIRPSFTLGGSGGGIAYNREEFIEICERGLDLSPTNELLIEESILGWKEFELEVVRDKNDNCIIVCTIENIDAVGVHTGDSATVAPAQTLTDKEYQLLRNASIAILREIGVETGGSNVQFAINPENGRLVVIEMNPRVSRSSALASKATGFPIAKVAAKLAVGYTLDELSNEITQGIIPTSFEPTIDYVVTKLPRFNFEKFPHSDNRLTTQMKSVGEVMAIGRTFKESLQKAICSLERGSNGFDSSIELLDPDELQDQLRAKLKTAGAHRLWYIADAYRCGFTVDEVAKLTQIDPWFLAQISELIDLESQISQQTLSSIDAEKLLQYKKAGFSDERLAVLLACKIADIFELRKQYNINPTYKRVDSCAGEFPTETAYLYSTYEQYCEANPSDKPKVMVLGSGPNRIGQGIEFDYCCVHAAFALEQMNYETIMVNCNPETVSTDYDTSDRLYFEPLTLSHVLSIIDVEKPEGVIVQYGGQTPLKLAQKLKDLGVPIIGTSPEAIHQAEDREAFKHLIEQLNLKQPDSGIARSIDEGLKVAKTLGYPLMVRPSYVLGGRAMEIVYDAKELSDYLFHALHACENTTVLLDRFLDDAIEVDVDAICDGESVCVVGIMEHIEQAGVHSGDSACSIPPYQLSTAIQQQLKAQVEILALAMRVVGLVNVQFAIKNNDIYILEVNPRASRTVPFVSKAIGVPVAQVAAKVMMGKKIHQVLPATLPKPQFFSVKLPVFPFIKFQGADPILGPEMKSTGEVMGIADDFGSAYGKALIAAGVSLPSEGKVFISVRNADKKAATTIAKDLFTLGFKIIATKGTAEVLKQHAVDCTIVNKVNEGSPHIVDHIKNGEVDLIINTTEGKQAIKDSFAIRRNALQHKVCYTTTLAGARAMITAMKNPNLLCVNSLEKIHHIDESISNVLQDAKF